MISIQELSNLKELNKIINRDLKLYPERINTFQSEELGEVRRIQSNLFYSSINNIFGDKRGNFFSENQKIMKNWITA